MFEFSQLAGNTNVPGWARFCFLIRYPQTQYRGTDWNMQRYPKAGSGVSIGSNGARNFKLQLIM